MRKIDHALALAGMGFRVFPLACNSKLPAFKGVDWRTLTTSDPARVKELWGTNDYNIGIATGNGLLVLDFDTKGGQRGLEDFEDFRSRGLDFSNAVYTANGGVHVYLRLPEGIALGNSVKKIAPATDTRCENGYVVGPGSRIDGKDYYWIKETQPTMLAGFIAAADWLIEACDKQHEKETLPDLQIELDTDTATTRAIAYLTDNAPCAVEGEGGNQVTYQIAARVKDFGISESLCFDLLMGRWNEEKAIPPWQPDDLERIVGNAYRYGTAAIGKFDASLEFEPYVMPSANAPARAAKPAGRRGLTVLSFQEAVARAADPTPQYLVKDIIDRETLSMIYGPSNAGKSFVVLELARCVAMGEPFAGHKVRRGAVLYIGLEGARRLANRFLALHKEKTGGMTPPLYMAMGGLNLFVDDSGARDIIEHAKVMAADGHPPTLIIIDTLTRAAAGAKEKETSDMNVVFDRARQIIAATNAHVCLIHHPGKDESKGARGSYSMTADVDTLINVKPDPKGKKSGRLIFDKQRDGDMLEDIHYRLCKVKIGCDDDLDDITSCVVDFRVVRQSAEEEASDALREALSAFDMAAAVSGPVVKTAAWLTALAGLASKNGDNPPSQKSLEDRARRLVTMGVIEKAGRGKYRRSDSRKTALRDSFSVPAIPQNPQNVVSARIAA